MAYRRNKRLQFDDNLSVQTYTDLWNAATSTVVTDPQTFEIVSSLVLATVGGAALVFAGQKLFHSIRRHRYRNAEYGPNKSHLNISDVSEDQKLHSKRNFISVEENNYDSDNIKRFKPAVDDRKITAALESNKINE